MARRAFRLWAVACGATLGMLGLGTTASAQEGQRRLPAFTVRGSLGLGSGSSGFAGRAGLSASVWPLPILGASIEYQTAASGAELFGPTDEFTLLSAGPSLRVPLWSFCAQSDLLFGAGHGDSSPGGSLDVFGPSPPKHQLKGLAVTVIQGFYWHPSVFELGPSLELTFYDRITNGTLGFTFGGAIR